jgi:hypothetical protein
VSTQEDREHDERQEYGYSNPLDPFARMSEILADRFAPIEYADDVAAPVENPVENQGYTWDELVAEKSRDRAEEFFDRD